MRYQPKLEFRNMKLCFPVHQINHLRQLDDSTCFFLNYFIPKVVHKHFKTVIPETFSSWIDWIFVFFILSHLTHFPHIFLSCPYSMNLGCIRMSDPFFVLFRVFHALESEIRTICDSADTKTVLFYLSNTRFSWSVCKRSSWIELNMSY